MGASRPQVAPIFRSETQLRVLGALYAAPSAMTVKEISDRLQVPLSTVSREVARLEHAGIVATHGRARSKFVEARRDFSWAPALAELLDRTVGIAAAAADAFEPVPGTELVAIFGSWAARRLGRDGPPPRDIDVLVVGSPSSIAVIEAKRRAEQRTGAIVEPIVVTPEAWADPSDDPVLRSMNDGPLVVVGSSTDG